MIKLAETISFQNILSKIGKTPLIPIGNNTSKGLKLYAKLEWQNPFGSLKDRPAYWMIREGERQGLLKKGETIVIEPTSGNTGIALTGLCSSLGYAVEVVIPKRVSLETKSILKSLGANLLETDDDLCPRVGPGTDQSIALAESMVKNHGGRYFMPNQYSNEANFQAHYETTGPEIWNDTEGKVTHFITGVGTGGTVTGTSTYLKKQNSRVKVVAVQPQRNHHLQGLRNLEESKMPDLLKRRINVIDDLVTVSDSEAFKTVSETAKSDNLFIGPSSGATLSAALSLAENVKEGIGVVILGDSGHKYWSVFNEFGVFSQQEFNHLKTNANHLSNIPFLNDVNSSL